MRKSLRTLVSPLFFVMSLLMGGQVFALSAKEDIQLIPQLPAQGNFDVTFHPGKTVTKGETVQVQFGVPLPVGVLTDPTKLSLKLNGVEIPIAVKEIVYWYATDTRAQSIRSALVTADITFADIAPKSGVLTYGVARTANYTKTVPTDPTASWVSISQEVFPTEFSSTADIREPKVYATFAPKWLDQSLLRTRAVPVGENASFNWWDEGTVEFGKTFVNDVSSYVTDANKVVYETSSGTESWLFDRAQTLYGTYIRTGDVKWLRHAHRNAQFYRKNVDANGYFKLKLAVDPSNPDLKYSYGQSMLLDLIFTGDQAVVTPVKNVAKFAATWNPVYSYTTNFWTERHQTYALLGALSAWEVTGEAAYLTRAQSIVQSSLNQIRSPVNGWQPNGCMLHTLESHEGDSRKDPVCSSFMSALLAEAVFKYYVHTKDTKALEFLSEYGTWIEKYVAYSGTEGHLTGMILPYYLASSALKIAENGDWGSVEHGCDVGGFAARAAWAKKALGQNYSATRQLATSFLTACKYSMDNWHRVGSDVNYGKAVWRLTPSREYSWWFGTTLDYDWLLRSIDYVDTKPMPPSNFTAVPLAK
jgi:hypothetical protein